MELPNITIPKIDLPFDISPLLHPSVVHFAIALPVIILLLEFYNVFVKRKSIGVFSFMLIILTILILVASYFTGGVDGKEAYSLLSSDGKAELKAHKLLGIYVLGAALVVLFFKFLAMTGKRFFKVLYFIMLIGLILITFQQGKEGGELVYEHGSNVSAIKALDDKLFNMQEELGELQEELDEAAEVKKGSAKAPTMMKMAQPVVAEEPVLVEPNITDTLLDSASVEMDNANKEAVSAIVEDVNITDYKSMLE